MMEPENSVVKQEKVWTLPGPLVPEWFALIVPLLWLIWLSVIEDTFYVEILRWVRDPEGWRFDDPFALFAVIGLFLAAVAQTALAWRLRRWWVAGVCTLVGVLAMAAALLGAVAEAASAAPRGVLDGEDRAELSYAVNRLRTKVRRRADEASVVARLERMQVLHAEGRVVVLGLPRSWLSRVLPLRSEDSGSFDSYPLDQGTLSDALLPEDFPALKERVLTLLEARGGLTALEAQHASADQLRSHRISDLERYLSWRYPDHLVLVAVLAEPLRADAVNAKTLRLRVPPGTQEHRLAIASSHELEEVRYSSSYRLRGPEALLAQWATYGFDDALDNLADRPRTYANAWRLVFGMDAQQAALREAGACWLEGETVCDE